MGNPKKKPSKRTGKNVAKRAGPAAGEPVGTVVRAALADDVLRMLRHEPGARRGEVEDVHQMRTSVRRMRSDLRFFRPVLEDRWAQDLRDELKWLAGVLGAVRDLDVLEQRFREAIVEAGEGLTPSDAIANENGNGAAGAPDPAPSLFAEIDRQRDEARSALFETLDSLRYRELRSRTIDAARSPHLSDEANRPLGETLTDLLARIWKSFRKHVRAVPHDAPFEELHELRKRAKRTRYAAESAASALGDEAARTARNYARRAHQIQDVLGLMQDAVVGSAFLHNALDTVPDDDPTRTVIHTLIDRQTREAKLARDQFHRERYRTGANQKYSL